MLFNRKPEKGRQMYLLRARITSVETGLLHLSLIWVHDFRPFMIPASRILSIFLLSALLWFVPVKKTGILVLPYDLNKPAEVLKLPGRLKEISSIIFGTFRKWLCAGWERNYLFVRHSEGKIKRSCLLVMIKITKESPMFTILYMCCAAMVTSSK